MREKIKSFCFITFICFIFIIVYLFCNKIDTQYKMKGKILKEENNIIFIQDNAGLQWTYNNNTDNIIFTNKNIIIKFFNNNSDNRNDDIILSIKQE